MDAPNADFAMRLAAEAMKARPSGAKRFTMGLRHYVYEVTFADRAPVVVRIALPENRDKLTGAVRLSEILRPRGVPLPALLAHDTFGPMPYMIIERLPGRDLGDVMERLSEAALDQIAAKVVAAQAIVAALPSSGRYGYAFSADEARYEKWSHVLDANLAGCRKRIVSAGLFTQDPVDAVCRMVDMNRRELDELGATAFMHDTTTKNVIVTEEGAFSGIVDVDSLCWGDACFPAALTMASIMFHGGPVSYVHAWMRHASRPMDRLFWVYVCQFLVTFMSQYGQTFNDGPLALPEDERGRLQKAFAEAVGRG